MRKLKTVITAIAMAASAACLAGPLHGPYCVSVPGLAPDCKYYDETSCARAAVQRQGACVDRSTGFALRGPNAGARYCLINAGDAKCNYYDAASCVRAVRDLGGGSCVERVRSHPGG